jgi:HD-GYP domain-containing protein (c-di-GMP phosphodiesterase class II)
MNLKPIKPSDIALNSPLLWDIYDNEQNLMLSKGHVIGDAERLGEISSRGLLIEAHFADQLARLRPSVTQSSVRPEVVRAVEKPSVFRSINAATKRLERLLYGLHAESDAQEKILELAKMIIDAVDLNPDIALGCILLDQEATKYAVRHCVDTAIVATLIARATQKTNDEISILVAAALTMNVGMLRQQDALQSKKTALTEAERALIRSHPQAGVDALKQAGINHAEWLSHVLLHHENEDGSGYPVGKGIAAIPQTTKILTLADHYCACVVQRQYRKVLLPQVALKDVLIAGGKPRDPLLAAYFIKELSNHPPGTMVRLHNRETGVVTTRSKGGAPAIVHALFNPHGEPLSLPLQRDTTKEQFAITEVVPSDQVRLRFSMQQLWGEQAAA